MNDSCDVNGSPVMSLTRSQRHNAPPFWRRNDGSLRSHYAEMFIVFRWRSVMRMRRRFTLVTKGIYSISYGRFSGCWLTFRFYVVQLVLTYDEHLHWLAWIFEPELRLDCVKGMLLLRCQNSTSDFVDSSDCVRVLMCLFVFRCLYVGACVSFWCVLVYAYVSGRQGHEGCLWRTPARW